MGIVKNLIPAPNNLEITPQKNELAIYLTVDLGFTTNEYFQFNNVLKMLLDSKGPEKKLLAIY